MNEKILELKEMKRAMRPFVFVLWELTYESNAQNVLEIGVRQGQSSRAILSALNEKKSGILTSIDIKDRRSRLTNDFADNWNFIVGDSTKQETLDKVNGIEYDMLLIDGDHSYDGVKKDYEMYAPLVKKGGFLLLHDVCNKNCGVPQFWNELSSNKKITLPFGVAGMGLIQV